MNRWGIPKELEAEVRARDRDCVYCRVKFTERSTNGDRRRYPTWEHFDNARWNDRSIMEVNVALCCHSCNCSKGAKLLREWLASPYCIQRHINEETVADPVRRFLGAQTRDNLG